MKLRSRILSALLVTLLLCTLLTGCGSISSYAKAESYEPIAPSAYMNGDYGWYNVTTEAEAPMAMPMEPSKSGSSYDGGYSYTEESKIQENGTESDTTQADKIIYTGNVSMETTDFDRTVSELENTVNAMGGFVQDSDLSGNTSYDADGTVRIVNRYANYTLRLPTTKFSEFLDKAGTFGNITSNSRSAENVTSQYTDLEAHLSSLRTEQERLLDMLKKATDVDYLIVLEDKLASVRYQIESIERNLRNLDNKIAFSTVYLYVREVSGYRPSVSVKRTFGQRMSDAFKNGWENLVDGLEDFAVGISGAFFGLLFAAIVILVIVLIIRRIVKNYRKKHPAKPAAPKTPVQPPQNKTE